jgi:hypothetical protein
MPNVTLELKHHTSLHLTLVGFNVIHKIFKLVRCRRWSDGAVHLLVIADSNSVRVVTRQGQCKTFAPDHCLNDLTAEYFTLN